MGTGQCRGFRGQGWTGQGQEARDRLIGRVSAWGALRTAFAWPVAPVVRAGGQCPGAWGPRQGSVGCGLGPLGLSLKGVLVGTSLAICRHRLGLAGEEGGSSARVSKAPGGEASDTENEMQPARPSMLPAASPARPRLSPLELVTLAAEHCDHDSAIPVVTAAHGAPDCRSRAAARSPENGPPCWRAAGCGRRGAESPSRGCPRGHSPLLPASLTGPSADAPPDCLRAPFSLRMSFFIK